MGYGPRLCSSHSELLDGARMVGNLGFECSRVSSCCGLLKQFAFRVPYDTKRRVLPIVPDN